MSVTFQEHPGRIAAGIVILVGAIVGTVFLVRHHPLTSHSLRVARPSVAAHPPALAPVEATKNAVADTLAMATVRKGEGIENPLIRQLMADPLYWGFTGDTSRGTAVTHWAHHEAQIIAILAGYVDWKFGATYRIYYSPTVKHAFVLEKTSSGKIHVVEKVYRTTSSTVTARETARSNTPPPSPVTKTVVTRTLASTIGHAHFLGWPDEHHHVVPAYEYLYTGVPA